MMLMDDLRVEHYEAEEVSRKEKKILERVAIAGSTIGVVLSLFGLVLLGRSAGSYRNIPRPEHQIVASDLRNEHLPGGGGAWFFSWVDWRDW